MKKSDQPNRLMTREEVCDFLQISPASLERRRREGLKVVRIGTSIRYNPDDVLAYVNDQTVQEVPE